MADVIMPRLSDSMEEGTILRWLKSDGDSVQRGEELLEVETDKATMTYEADSSGVLAISEQEGATVPVGEVIGRLGDSAGAGSQSSAATDATQAAEPAEAAATAPDPAPRTAAGNGANGAPAEAPARSRVAASPLARRIAGRLGVDLAALTGSGPQGRIVKADVVAAHEAAGASAQAPTPAPASAEAASPPAPRLQEPAQAAPQASPGGSRGEAQVEELSRTQSLIARRMAESRATVPEFALEVDVDMGALLELRAELKQHSDPAPSINDFIVKASALALRRHPRANGSYRDGRFELHSRVNVGIAVAADDALIVPTVFDADEKSLGALAADARALIERVRSRAITPPELAGATFTVSNLGMFGIDRFEGIINPPQAAILCVGATRERPVAVDGELAVRPVMSMTLACDHRILYGADAAEFLGAIRDFLERPLTLAL